VRSSQGDDRLSRLTIESRRAPLFHLNEDDFQRLLIEVVQRAGSSL
jgi:hypothetical protein